MLTLIHSQEDYWPVTLLRIKGALVTQTSTIVLLFNIESVYTVYLMFFGSKGTNLLVRFA